LMETVPVLKRKVAGKSIPVEKFVIRKADKYRQQGRFLLRPGLELLHVWNLYSKMPHERLLVLRDQVDAEIARLADDRQKEYRHAYYYDDLAVLLLTKGCVLRELAHPTCVSTLAMSSSSSTTREDASSPPLPPSMLELSVPAADTFLRLLRLVPLIERDHYLGVLGRFHLGNLYLAMSSSSSSGTTDWARAHWKCILGGKPLSSAPFLSADERRAHVDQLAALAEKEKENVAFAPTCGTEEGILQESSHPSLAFYDKPRTGDWPYSPPYWSDSKKYSLENMLQVRTFNADNRLKESLVAAE
ncbi:Tetratricopeptide repeat protein 39B, partial [Coemansia aciculifera]